MSPSEKSNIFRNLSKYVRNGMGIEKACESLLSQPGVSQAERSIYDAIEKGVTSGKSIADSMSQSSRLENLDYQMLNASEQGGKLDAGLSHLADYYERLSRTQQRIKKGLTYPLFLFHFALIATTLIGAAFSRLSITGDSKPFWPEVWATGKWALLFYLFAIICVYFLFSLRKKARSLSSADQLLNKIPILGKARKFAALERFSSVFEIFLLAGMKMDEGLEGASSASNSGIMKQVAISGGKSLRSGELLAKTMLDNPAAFPNDFARSIASAEEAGMLDTEFGRWKQFYGESLSDSMAQLAEWVPKLVYYFVLIIVAAMIIKAGLGYLNLITGSLDAIF